MKAKDTALARTTGGFTAEQALAATSYHMANRSQQIIDAIRLLEELHGARDLLNHDTRCKTCRTSRGKPEPWPCRTYEQFGALLGVPVREGSREMFRTMGRFLNRQATIEDVNRAIEAADVEHPEDGDR